MPLKCAICTFNNIKNKNIAFFKFPMTIPIILQQWVKAVNKKDWTPTISSRICQLHFKSTDFTNASKILRLKPDVIPSQNLNNKDFENNDLHANSNLYADSKYADNNIHTDVEISTLQTDFVRNIGTSKLNKTEFISNTSNVMISTDSTISTVTKLNTIKQEVTTQRDNTISAKKRKAVELLEETNINKYLKLEEENQELKIMIKSLTQSYEEKLNNQADMFKILIEKEKNALKKKLTAEKNKFQYLQKKINRKQRKLETVMQELKTSKMLNNKTYDILR